MKAKKKRVRKIIYKIGRKFLKVSGLIPPAIWSSNKEFMQLFSEIKGFTVVGPHRCFMLWQLAQYAANKEGEIAEVGVYKGGTAKIIAKGCPNKSVHIFDTFSGMPKATLEIDHHEEGDFSDTSLEAVKDFLGDCQNIIFHPGYFPDTTSGLGDRKFCFVYVDVDIYTSVKDCLEFFYKRMNSGGIMVFDDYGSPLCLGATRAIDEFFANKKEKPIITTQHHNYITEHQCAIIKL